MNALFRCFIDLLSRQKGHIISGFPQFPIHTLAQDFRRKDIGKNVREMENSNIPFLACPFARIPCCGKG
jgi:hypothetical protein